MTRAGIVGLAIGKSTEIRTAPMSAPA